MNKITIADVRRYQKEMETVKSNGYKAGDFKALGRKLQKEFPELTVPNITAILNNRSEEILKLL